ncbi:MAG: hypothetical protein U1F76_06565 [Candidatus Competibacteraceae bacterium]
MAATATPGPVHRTTLLVGYGNFGLDALRRFLASTATRGVLVWEESTGADSNERRLCDLALLWIRDPFETGGSGTNEESILEGSHIELMRDLYQQIQTVEQAGAKSAFEEAMEAAARVLLDAATRAARRENLPLGLDVIVLARPGNPAVIGRLTPLLVAGLERLHQYATQLQRAVTGAAALNFIQILDFANYWQRSDQGQQIRVAVQGAVERWQQRRQEGRPTFGRIYLVDGHTADGIRDERQRIDEISLFLEFLLFEGQRGGELQPLYQALSPQEPPVATFGIRLLERSAGLLSRLAAARFGIDWLDYLAGDDTLRLAAEPVELRRQLAPYRAAELEHLVKGEGLWTELYRQLERLTQELAGLQVDLPDWPQQIQTRYEQAIRRIESELATQVHNHMQTLSRDQLANLPAALHTGIDAALHHERQPTPLGAVIREVEAAVTELEQAPVGIPPTAGGSAAALAEFATLHRAYRRFQQEQVDADGLISWWPLFALVLSLGLSPVLAEVVDALAKPDATAHFLVQGAYASARWLVAHPPLLIITLWLLFWGVGAKLFQRGIRGRIQRARRFWHEPERGRLVDRLRALLRPDGGLGKPLVGFLERLLQDMALSLRSEVSRELGRVLKRLQERRRELTWLREQLREFLKLYGLNPTIQSEEWTRLHQETTGIRYAVEQYQDFQRMLQTNPPSPERFLSTQAERRPFTGWEQRYSAVFLYPLRFIDELSRQYRDPFLEELAKPGLGNEQVVRSQEFRAFLKRYGTFALAFSWKAQAGVPVDRLYCLLPRIWLGLQGSRDALTDLGIVERNMLVGEDVARAYLLRLQLGVETACLLN